jgi:zinc protease
MNTYRMQFALALLAIASFVPVANAQAKTSQAAQPAPAKKSQQSAAKTSKAVSRAEAWKKIPIPPLPVFKPAQPTRVQLSNGMVIFLQEDHELPLVSVSTNIRGGSRSEPAAKVGMLDVYGDVWRTGGTTKRTGDEMDDYLEARAAKLETGASGTSTSMGFNCLKQDFDDVFAMYLELLRDPAFREDKIALAKNQLRTGISRRNDDPDSIAGRESAFLVYGKESPYAREPEYWTVDAITREDLISWHKQHLAPNNIIVGIVGDFDSKQMEARFRQAFESWPKGEQVKQPEIPTPGPKPGVYFVNKEDVNQSDIRIVGLGIDRHNPDYFPLTVMNEILSGGFSSRMFSNLRTKAGLAYSVGGAIGSAFDHRGMAQFSMGTKSETTVAGIQGLFSELDDMLKNPPTAAELKRAKDNILNSFIFNFDTPAEVMRERMTYEFFGYPLDFLERYRAGVEKTTLDDVSRVAKKYIQKDQYAVLVVGNEAEFKTPLTTVGQVTPLNITIPTSPSGNSGAKSTGSFTTLPAAAPAPKASNDEGKALIAKVVQFLGGEQKLQSIKSIQQKVTSVRKTAQGDLPIAVEQTIVYPDRLVAVANLMGMEMKNVVTPSAVFMAAPQGIRDFTGADKDEAQRSIQRDIINIARHANDPAWIFAAGPNQNVGDTDAAVLDIASGDFQMRWFVDPKTGAVIQTEGKALGQSGPVQRTTQYGGWKDSGGVKLYSERKVSENGNPVATDTIEQWTLNPQVDPKLFDKPATTSPVPQ